MEDGAVCGPERSPEEERLVIRDVTIAAESQCKEGDTFYLITNRWWQQWLEYVNQDVTSIPNASHGSDTSFSSDPKRPPTIDNTDLIYEVTSEISNSAIELHDTLIEGRDYILLPQEVWNRLHGWYGGGPALSRKAISTGMTQSEMAIEVYQLRLQLLVEPKGEQAIIRISKKETVGELYRKACEIFELTLDQILVEVVTDGNGMTFDRCIGSVQENGSAEECSVHLEPVKSSSSIAGGSSTCRTGSSGDFDILPGITSKVGTRAASIGLTGLLNLGNTCFMNSAIQCLVHTPEFARYFREDYHQEINWQNPLGMVGELALAFGELLRKLWAPGRTPVSPRPFKTKLARFAPQFSGYNQHDSQELLAFLLDGLHEDLNRVKHKPYTKTKDADGRPDEEVADEYWQNHIARNNSIIVDVCQGQYKSTLVCPVCGKVSVTFDPFMYLSLPLQFTSARSMTVMVFTSDGSTLPAACTVSVSKHARCKDLIQALSSACSLKPGEKLLLVEILGHLIHQFLDDHMTLLSTIKDDDHLAAFKVPNISSDSMLLQLIHRCEERDFSNSKCPNGWKPCGTPLTTQISRDDPLTGGDVQKIVHKMLFPMLKLESPQDVCGNEASIETMPTYQDRDSSTLLTNSLLPLHLVDENSASIDLSTKESQTTKLSLSSSPLTVYLNWSTSDFEKYIAPYLENLPEVLKYGPAPKKSRNEPLSLYACMEAFLREEPLVTEDMWNCPRCKEQRQASKKLDLWRLPEVLVIHLKRFSYSRSYKHKLETFVNFPIHDFDLTNYVAHKNQQPQLYELYALCNHYGSMASGHYTAHIKLLNENRWYNFDDNHISLINEEEVKSAAAYVLFYRRIKEQGSPVSYGGHSYADHNHLGRR